MRAGAHRLLSIIFTASGAIAIFATPAFAHGGFAGPEELGRPLGVSAALAFICYWTVILWPSRRRDVGPSGNSGTRKRARRPSAHRLVDAGATHRIDAPREARSTRARKRGR